MFSEGLEFTKHSPSPYVSSLIPFKSLSPSCVLLDVNISQKSQAQNLYPVAWFQGNLPHSLSRETEPHRYSKCKGPAAWPRNGMTAGRVRIKEDRRGVAGEKVRVG